MYKKFLQTLIVGISLWLNPTSHTGSAHACCQLPDDQYAFWRIQVYETAKELHQNLPQHPCTCLCLKSPDWGCDPTKCRPCSPIFLNKLFDQEDESTWLGHRPDTPREARRLSQKIAEFRYARFQWNGLGLCEFSKPQWHPPIRGYNPGRLGNIDTDWRKDPAIRRHERWVLSEIENWERFEQIRVDPVAWRVKLRELESIKGGREQEEHKQRLQAIERYELSQAEDAQRKLEAQRRALEEKIEQEAAAVRTREWEQSQEKAAAEAWEKQADLDRSLKWAQRSLEDARRDHQISSDNPTSTQGHDAGSYRRVQEAAAEVDRLRKLGAKEPNSSCSVM